MNNTLYSKFPSIRIYNSGFEMQSEFTGNNKAPDTHGIKRAEITKFSKSSRRRLREFMLTNTAPDGYTTHQSTFTIPGSIIDYKTASQLWDNFQKNYISRKGIGMIWRKEIQKRGQYHWHTIIIAPGNISSSYIMNAWFTCINNLGIDTHKTNKGEILTGFRMTFPLAYQKSVDISTCNDKNNSIWYRYMQDHASKSKHNQIPDKGRHWGVVNRKLFLKATVLNDYKLSPGQQQKVKRFVQKMYKPSIKGKKIKKLNRGNLGKSVWFSEKSKLDAVKRYIEYVIKPEKNQLTEKIKKILN